MGDLRSFIQSKKSLNSDLSSASKYAMESSEYLDDNYSRYMTTYKDFGKSAAVIQTGLATA